MALPIEKSLDEIREEMFARIGEMQDGYAAKGWLPRKLNLNKGIFRGLIELWCWCLYQLYLFLQVVLKQAFPLTATDAWLDLHCRQVGLVRKAQTQARGSVVFLRSGTDGNVAVPAGRIVRTRTDASGAVYRFVTLEDAVLQAGATEVTVPVVAESYGAASNVTPGQICEIATVIPGVEAVTNRSGWLTSEGADTENNDSLKQRYTLAWAEGSGNNRHAYEGWARSVPGVVSARILDQHPFGQGTVGVVVRGTAGLPTDGLLDAVRSRVEAERPLNDAVTVAGPSAVAVTLTGTLTVREGDPVAIRAVAEARITALFTDPSPIAGIRPLEVGEDFALARATAEVMAIPGVVNVSWASPAADVDVAETGLAVLSDLFLTTTAEA